MKFKTLAFTAAAASALLLSACQSPQSTSLTFNAPAPNPTMQVQNAVVYVTARDSRGQAEVASYTSNGQLIKLSANPALTDLFQKIEQQDLISKGFRIGMANNSNAGVTVDIKTFHANVQQGDLKYNIDSKIQLTVHVQGARGQFSKNFEASNSQEGAFNAKTVEIQKVMDKTFLDVVNAIYRDQEVATAVNYYAH